MKFIKKYWPIIIILILCIIRFILSVNIPSFYLGNLRYDDKLMVNQLESLLDGNYLGKYNDITLVKGVAFPFFLFLAQLINVSYSIALTLLYISACLFFTFSIKKIVKNRVILVFIFAILLFNPISYSSELFQRLYRNSLSIIEALFFFGTIINIIASKKNNILNYIFLGVITSIMFVTREDNIWTIIVLAIVFLYKLYKNHSLKSIFAYIIPICVMVIILNVISFINYKYYKIYAYNELTQTSFKQAFIKILQIKDDEKLEKISVPKSTVKKLARYSKVLGLSEEEVEKEFSRYIAEDNGEMNNGKIVWFLRRVFYRVNSLKDGEKSEDYYNRLSKEIDELFKEGKLEKEFAFPSIFIYVPTVNELKQLPENFIKAISYTSSYKNIKTFSKQDLEKHFEYDEKAKAYETIYLDHHNAENMIDNNLIEIEIIRNIYQYFTIVFSILAIIVYLKNILKRDKLNLILHIILLTYLIILGGVTYTHTTAFEAIRYCYLGNVYILQNIFILLNIVRMYENYKEKRNKNELKGVQE